jgi:MFS family permease
VRVFYGWWMVGAGFGIELLIGALMFHAYGAYAVLLREEFGWSKTMVSAAFSMARAESGIFGPIQGWLTDRFGPRALIRVGLTIFAVGFMLFSRIDGPVAFFLTFFMMAVGTSLGGYLPISVAIVTWFRRRRALALSISGMGMALGGLLTPLVVGALARFGWRWTALASGVVVLAIGLPLSQLMRRPPETYGLTPDGEPRATTRTAAADGPSYTAREAMATRAFWYISLGHAAALLVVSAVMVHMVIHVTERLGYSLHQAGAVVALLTIMQLTGQLTGGWLGDRVSKRWICAGCMLGHATALMVLGLATAFWMVLAFAVLHGLSWGMRGPLMAAIRADYFGSASFGMISGVSSMVIMFGMMLGPLVAGVLADRTGSYVPGFTVLAAFAAAGSLAFAFARRPLASEQFRDVVRAVSAKAGDHA